MANGGARRLISASRAFGRRHRVLITVVGSLATLAVLGFLLAGRRHEFATALSSASIWVLAVTVALQIVALRRPQRGVAPHDRGRRRDRQRRVLYRASSVQVLGSVINGQLGVAARIAALRRSSPEVCPQVPDADRRGVPDPRRRGDARGAGVVHAHRPARAAVVDTAHRRRRARRSPAPACVISPSGRAGSSGPGSRSCAAWPAEDGSSPMCWSRCSRRSSATG